MNFEKNIQIYSDTETKKRRITYRMFNRGLCYYRKRKNCFSNRTYRCVSLKNKGDYEY